MTYPSRKEVKRYLNRIVPQVQELDEKIALLKAYPNATRCWANTRLILETENRRDNLESTWKHVRDYVNDIQTKLHKEKQSCY